MGKAQVRLDPDLADRLIEDAAANERSLTQEANARLREALHDEPQTQSASLTGANLRCEHRRTRAGRCLSCGRRV
jgi:hypothetical protein